jgi:hypothetical protein
VTFVEMSLKRSLPLILWAPNVVYYFDGQTQTKFLKLIGQEKYLDPQRKM